MILVTVDKIENTKTIKTFGLVKGTSVRAKNLGSDIMSGFKNMVGGEMTAYRDMMEEARKLAIANMVADAEGLGANAIVGIRLVSSSISPGVSEISAYGTAIIMEEL